MSTLPGFFFVTTSHIAITHNQMLCISPPNGNGWWLAFFTIGAALFGPKVGSFQADFSVAIPAATFLLLIMSGRRLQANRRLLSLIVLLMMAFIYVLLVSLINGVPDFQAPLRTARALASTFILGAIFYHLTSRGFITVKRFLDVIVASLALLAIVMLGQIIFPSTQDYFAELYQFSKGLRQYRAFGLTAGYDSAGYLVAFGSVMSLTVFLLKNRYVYLVIALLCGAAVMFSSRSSMALFAGLLLVTAIPIALKRANRMLRLLPVIAVIAVGFAFYVAPLFVLTIEFFDAQPSLARDIGYEATTQFAQTDVTGNYADMWFVPDGPWEWLFGTGVNVVTSDIGYIRILFMGGLGLLLFVVLYYSLSLYLSVSALRTSFPCQSNTEKDYSKILISALNVFVVIVFLGNLKNLYFFTRGYHELFVILSTGSLGFAEYYKSRSTFSLINNKA